MKLWTRDRLLLHQQPGANLDFAANAKWIDALIANCLYGVRPHDLPVIILRALIHCLNSLTFGRQTQQFEPAIALQVGDIKYSLWRGRLLQKSEDTISIAEPNQCSGSAGRTLHRGSENQIERSIIVEISDVQTHVSQEIVRCIGHPGDLGRVPALSFIFIGNANDGAVRLHRQQVEHSVIVRIGDGNRFNERQARRQGTLAELPLPLVHKYMRASGAIDDCGIGISVAIKISPGKSAQAVDSSKRMNRQKCPVAVISQNQRQSLGRT